ncbi:hypothetical protein LXL04_033527 [Taraxacum kok-saghyz]
MIGYVFTLNGCAIGWKYQLYSTFALLVQLLFKLDMIDKEFVEFKKFDENGRGPGKLDGFVKTKLSAKTHELRKKSIRNENNNHLVPNGKQQKT